MFLESTALAPVEVLMKPLDEGGVSSLFKNKLHTTSRFFSVSPNVPFLSPAGYNMAFSQYLSSVSCGLCCLSEFYLFMTLTHLKASYEMPSNLGLTEGFLLLDSKQVLLGE